jgi:hypothetical protein
MLLLESRIQTANCTSEVLLIVTVKRRFVLRYILLKPKECGL